MQEFEIWEDPETGVRFFFSHSGQDFTTGVMMIPSGKELPRHNRPLAIENLTQLSGKCLMKTFDEQENITEHLLEVGTILSMPKGQFHIHANPYEEVSYTLFKAVGDITAVVAAVRSSFTNIRLIEV